MNRRDVKDADPRSSTFTEWPTPPLTKPVGSGELKPGVQLQNEHKLAQSTNLFFSLYHSTAGTPAAVPKLSSAQISEHYSTCIKLSTENVSWYLCMQYFTALCASEMQQHYYLSFFTENYHKECIWPTPHWLHGRHSQAERLRAQLQGRNLHHFYWAPI